MSARFRFPVFKDGKTYFEFDGQLYEKDRHYLFIQYDNLQSLDASPLSSFQDPGAILWVEIANSGPLDMGTILGKKFTNLVRLEIYGCQVQKITGLEGLSSLVHLDLRWNNVSRIEGVGQLPELEYLDLSGNKIEKIENLGSLGKLSYLNLARNTLKKIEGLDNLQNLSYLNLSFNRITNLDKLQSVVDVDQVIIEYNPQRLDGEAQDKRILELKNVYQQFNDASNVQYVIVLTRDGLPLYSKAFSNVPIDENLVSGFLSAISTFGAEIGSKFGVQDPQAPAVPRDLEQLSYGQFKIILNVQDPVRTAVLLLRDASDSLKSNLDSFTRAFVDTFRATLESWRGQALPNQKITDLVEQHFLMDLIYVHNVLRGKADAYLEGVKDPRDVTRLVLEATAKEPFLDFFNLREVMETMKLDGVDELVAFDALNKLKARGIVYPLNPKIKHVAVDYLSITDAIPTDGKLILKRLHEKHNPKEYLRTMEEIDEFYKTVAQLEQLNLVTRDLRLTGVGEELGYYFSIFLE